MADVEFQDFIDEVLQKNDIVDLISEYAKPKRMGNRYAALCPLHNDKKSPSLSISPDKQVFHCFGCGAGGNVIHFVMAAEHLDFIDAVRLLADRAGISVPEFSKSGSGKAKENTDKKQLIYKINADAARYFYKNLASEKGKTALEYLQKRGIKNSTIKMFGLGYAPEGWTLLIDYLKEKGYKEHDIYDAGLAKMRDNGTYYDSFYDGRVMFPIINVQGNIIGFGGRIMVNKSDRGKYLNSPETLVFKKKENLFGLNLAKNNEGSLLLMEGYMDVISLHQAGITNAVASLGTAFTEEQAKLVKRYGGKAILCYDSDEAGKKATLRAGEILTNSGIRAKVLTITDGKDPDEYIQAKGGDMFKVLIEGAKPLIEYKIDEIKDRYFNEGDTADSIDTEKMIEFTEQVADVLAEIKNPVEYEIYSKRISQKTGISIDALDSRISNIRNAKLRMEERREEQRERRLNRNTGIDGEVDPRIYNAEALMLNLLCDKEVYKIARGKGLTVDNFSEGLHKKLAENIYNQYADKGLVDINIIFDVFGEENRGMIAKILLDDRNTRDKKKACEMPLNTLLGEMDVLSQQELLDKGDLEALDKFLKDKHRK